MPDQIGKPQTMGFVSNAGSDAANIGLDFRSKALAKIKSRSDPVVDSGLQSVAWKMYATVISVTLRFKSETNRKRPLSCGAAYLVVAGVELRRRQVHGQLLQQRPALVGQAVQKRGVRVRVPANPAKQ